MTVQTIPGRKNRQCILFFCGIFILLGCEVFFFRNVLFSDRLLGDVWDGRLTMLFTEHWYHVFRGEAAIADMGFFYPAANTLAYSDMFLSYGLIHSLLRFLGLDIYDAFKITQIIIHTTGTMAAFWLLYKELKTDFGWALFGTIAFSFSSTFSIQFSHAQMIAVSLVPLFAIFVIRFFKNIEIPGKRRRNAVPAIVILMLILYTAWYVFFFTALFTVTGIIIWIIRSISNRKETKFGIRFQQIKGLIPEIIIYLIILVLLMVPFAILELPILRMSGGRAYGEVSDQLPEAIDFINVSSENWLMGSIIREMELGKRNYTFEVIEGFSIAAILVFFCSWILVRNKNRRRIPETTCDHQFLTQTLAMTVVASCILCMRLSSNGVSFWWIVFRLFPGGTSIRAVARYLLFLSLPLAVAAALMGNEVSRKWKEKKTLYFILMTGIVVFAFLAGIHTDGVFANWTKAESEEFLSNVPAPPEDCESFYLSDVIGEEVGPYYQLDAYQIADKYGVKTIHGYSGLNPPGWGDMWDVHGRKYKRAVNGWIMNNQLENVYAYDEVKHSWSKHDPEAGINAVFDAKKKIVPETVSGIWDTQPEGEYSWTEKTVKILLRNKDIAQNGLKIKIGTVKDKYLQQNPALQPECSVSVNKASVGEIPVINGTETYQFKIEPSDDDLYEIEINTNCFFVPADIGENGDSRELALQLYYVGPAE